MTPFATNSFHLVHPAGTETELYLVRHGQTPANLNRQFAGATDVPLDETGMKQAEEVAARFQDFKIDGIVSSPLQRALYTAKSIGRVTGFEPVILEGLREINFGDAEMLTLNQLVAQFGNLVPALADRYDTSLAWPNGERRSEFHARVLKTINGILHDYADKSVAVVCHGGVIASILAHLEDGPRNDFERYRIANCSITHMSVTPEETIIHAWNDHSHISELIGPMKFEPIEEN